MVERYCSPVNKACRRKFLGNGALLGLVVMLQCCWVGSAVWTEAPACLAVNGTFYLPATATQFVRLGAVLVMEGELASLSNRVCQAIQMWVEFFSTTGTGVSALSGEVLGIAVWVEDVTAWASGPGGPVLDIPTMQNLTYATSKRMMQAHTLDTLFAPPSPFLVPHAALAGSELKTVVFTSLFSAEPIFACPRDCTTPEDCEKASFGCSRPEARRFPYLFSTRIQNFFAWAATFGMLEFQKVRTIAVVSDPLSKSAALAVKGVAGSSGIVSVADITISRFPDYLGAVPPAPDVLVTALQSAPFGTEIEATMEGGGEWEAMMRPFVELVKAQQADVVVALVPYEACLGLVRALKSSGHTPPAVVLQSCLHDTDWYGDLGDDSRWLLGVHTWDARMWGHMFEERPTTLVQHYHAAERHPVSGALLSAAAFATAFEQRFGARAGEQDALALAMLYAVEV